MVNKVWRNRGWQMTCLRLAANPSLLWRDMPARQIGPTRWIIAVPSEPPEADRRREISIDSDILIWAGILMSHSCDYRGRLLLRKPLIALFSEARMGSGNFRFSAVGRAGGQDVLDSALLIRHTVFGGRGRSLTSHEAFSR